jgi:hypothetical protein
MALDVCSSVVGSLPVVQSEAQHLGQPVATVARTACESGFLLGQTIESLLRQRTAVGAAPCAVDPWTTAGAPSQ